MLHLHPELVEMTKPRPRISWPLSVEIEQPSPNTWAGGSSASVGSPGSHPKGGCGTRPRRPRHLSRSPSERGTRSACRADRRDQPLPFPNFGRHHPHSTSRNRLWTRELRCQFSVRRYFARRRQFRISPSGYQLFVCCFDKDTRLESTHLRLEIFNPGGARRRLARGGA